MPVSRADMLMNEPDKPRVDISKLKAIAEEGGLFASLVSHPGWSKLQKDWITPRSSMDRIRQADKDKLAEERDAINELLDLLNFIDRKIKDGSKAADELRNL